MVLRCDGSLPVTRPVLTFWVRWHRLRRSALPRRDLPVCWTLCYSVLTLFIHPSPERTVEPSRGGFLPSEGANLVIFPLPKGVKSL